MTKADIIEKITQSTGVEKIIVKDVIESFMENVKEAMIDGQNVYLRGFGSFILKRRATKVARNISKNTSITIPAHNIPALKPCKKFLNAVKKNS